MDPALETGAYRGVKAFCGAMQSNKLPESPVKGNTDRLEPSPWILFGCPADSKEPKDGTRNCGKKKRKSELASQKAANLKYYIAQAL